MNSSTSTPLSQPVVFIESETHPATQGALQGGLPGPDDAAGQHSMDAKLEATVAPLRAQGWGWVDVWPTWDQDAFERMGKITKALLPMTDDALMRRNALRIEKNSLSFEFDQLMDKLEERDELSGKDEKRVAFIEKRLGGSRYRGEIAEEIAAIEAPFLDYPANLMALTGVIVGHDGGELRIEYGCVRPSDRNAVEALDGAPKTWAG